MSDNMCIFVTANMSLSQSKLIYHLIFLNYDFYDIVFGDWKCSFVFKKNVFMVAA